MLRLGTSTLSLCGVMVLAASAQGGEIALPVPLPVNKGEVINHFLAEHPGNDFTYAGHGIERVYGPAFSTGPSAQQSAEQFRLNFAGMWGITPNDLAPVGPFGDGSHVLPLMYIPETGQYKFTALGYTQVRDNVPVFRGNLVLLTRNEANYPLVLASASLRDIGGFRVSAQQAAKVNAAAGFRAIQRMAGPQADIVAGSTVIYAGVDDFNLAPVLAVQFIAEGGNPLQGTYYKQLILTDASTGAIVYQESLVHDVDVVGNVSGMATTGWAADVCAPEALRALPYARVSIGATSVNADVNGNFTIPNAGSSAVTVSSIISGQYFNVAPTTTLTQSVTPPGPANFIHNQANTSATNLAEVNAYIHANVVRDFVLVQNPAYPVIAGQTGFAVNVNIASTCNAFYNLTSINFYQAGGGCSNTANSTVVYHEYGHHIVASGGSGQGAFGEGFGDVMGVLITDTPCTGDGFQACGTCLRTATQNCQYLAGSCSSCGSEIHACGVLLSSSVWSVRNNLQLTNPGTYRQIISSLAVNEVLLHTGISTITTSITIDYLTLDDNDGNIGNGTPHYNEINGGFSAHNLPGPALALLDISYPNGRPAYVAPNGGTTMRVNVAGVNGSPQPGTGQFFVDTGSGFVQGTMNIVSPNVYDAVFPASTCGATVRYYVTAQTTTAQTVFSPSTAPGVPFTAISATGLGPTVFSDNFQSDMGWTTSFSGATTGFWERGVPDTCIRGNPTVDADASGMCYVTQISVGGNCDTDIDNGSVTLTSPIMDASQGAPVLSYWRWYSNTFGGAPEADTFVIEFSTNGGSTWQNLETVGPSLASPNPQVNGGWFQKSFSLVSVPGFTPTSQFRVRFTASDLGSGSVVEAGVDGVKLVRLNCTNPCPADINSSGTVDINDLLTVIGAWGPCPLPCPPSCPADINGDCQVDINDMLIVIGAWGPCP